MNNDRYRVTVDKGLEKLIPTFMRNRQEELDALKAALDAADFERIRHLGHRMKGVGDSYGFGDVTMLGKQIENSAQSGDRVALQASIARYAEYLEKVQIAYG